MTRLDYYYGKWNLTGIAVHETRFDEDPVFGSEFYPFPISAPHEEEPDRWDPANEYAFSLIGTFSAINMT